MAKHPIFFFATSLSLSSLLLVVVFLEISFAMTAGDSCQMDEHMVCKYYKPYKSIYCTTNDWIQINCAKMCGLCSPVCQMEDDMSCKHFKPYKSTYCQTDDWVKTNCAKMCDLCTTKTMSPVDGNWGKWGDWSDCSKTCGNGQKNRSRECNDPAPMHGGRSCDGNATLIDVCKDTECAGDECGKQFPIISVILIGGNHADEGKWPWQVAIRKNKWELHPYCGGTLIRDNIVLTAAHCFKGRKPRAFRYWVRVGDHDVTRKDLQEEDIRAKRIIIHEQYNYPFKNDIALIVLSKKVTLKDRVQVACLPMTDNPPVPQTNDNDRKKAECYTTGWGARLSYNSKYQPDFLQELDVPLRNQQNCSDKYSIEYPDVTAIVRDYHICAGGEEYRDTCQVKGDSGGPLVCRKSKDVPNRFVVRGVTSFGPRRCAKGVPTVYTNVFHYIDWINKNINANQH